MGVITNAVLTPTQVTRESLRILHNNLSFSKGVNREYDDYYARSGAKIGASLKVRLPNRYTVNTSVALNATGVSEQSTTVTITNQDHVDIQFSTQELTLSIDDFSKRVLGPAVAKLASTVDFNGLTQFKNVYNEVGTAGTSPNSAAIILAAAQKLNEFAAPDDGYRSVVLSPAGHASMVNALTNLYNPQQTIAEQFRKGLMGQALGFEFAMDQNVNSFTTGSRLLTDTITVAVTSSDGDTTLAITGCTSGKTIKTGDVFTIAGVNAVNPETGQNSGSLAMFVVTADTSASGSTTATLQISPVIQSTGAYATVASLPQSTNVLTFIGAASTAYPIHLAYHKDAFVLASADLLLPGGVDFAHREVLDGISLRVVRQYDINYDALPTRIDVLYGWKTIRPELACRITG